jgi:Ca2+-binding RTX toxin-like protein
MAIPTITLSSVATTEGEAAFGIPNLPVTLTLSEPSLSQVTVAWRTLAGTALAGSDFAAASGTVTFQPGQTQVTIFVPAAEFQNDEPDEAFVVELFDPQGAVLSGNVPVLRETCFLLDETNSLQRAVFVSSPEVVEVNGSPSQVVFDVELSRPAGSAITFSFATRDGTAIAGQDYRATSGSLTFAAGQTHATVTVDLLQDFAFEGDHGFSLKLTGALPALIAAGGSRTTGTATINDNDIGGTPGDDDLTGTARSEGIWGFGGNDRLSGAGANDALFGGGGSDSLNGGTGSDSMEGGTGNDFYVLDSTGDRVVELAGGGTDTVATLVTRTLWAQVENLELRGSADIDGTGNGLANTITGNVGDNVLRGGLGADVLAGGRGVDRLFGEGGADDFVFAGGDTGPGALRDVIADFQSDIDQIDLRLVDADTTRAGNQVFTFIGAAGFSGAAGEVRYANGVVSMNTDGDLAVEAQILLANGAALNGGSFLL